MPGQLGEGSLLACEDIACADKQMSTKPMTLHLPVKAAFFRLSRNVSAHHRPQGQERKKSQDNYQTVHNANANIASKPLNNCVCVPRTCRQHLQACQAGRPRPARPSLQQQLRKPRREQRRRNQQQQLRKPRREHRRRNRPRTYRQHLYACQAGSARPARPSLKQ